MRELTNFALQQLLRFASDMNCKSGYYKKKKMPLSKSRILLTGMTPFYNIIHSYYFDYSLE